MKSVAEQCRAMGLAPGDVIYGTEHYAEAWNEARLELLWMGEEVAVWRAQTRNSWTLEWSLPREEANWTLSCREWRKAEGSAGGEE